MFWSLHKEHHSSLHIDLLEFCKFYCIIITYFTEFEDIQENVQRLLLEIDLLNYTLFTIIVKSTKNKTVRC
jgi:hypothetical protein